MLFWRKIYLSQLKSRILRDPCLNPVVWGTSINIFCDWLAQFIYFVALNTEVAAQRWSMKKGVLKNFAKFTGKHLWQSLFLTASFLEKRLWHRCFPMNLATFLRTLFLTEHLWWMLLYTWRLSTKSVKILVTVV